jgi:hypothetical protein
LEAFLLASLLEFSSRLVSYALKLRGCHRIMIHEAEDRDGDLQQRVPIKETRVADSSRRERHGAES